MKAKEEGFRGTCDCECPSCEIGNHHHCRDTEKCKMPKSYGPERRKPKSGVKKRESDG